MFKKTWVLAVIAMLMLAISGCSTITISEKEVYPLSPGINVIDLTGYNGGINWLPVRANENPRIEIVKEVYGSDLGAMERY